MRASVYACRLYWPLILHSRYRLLSWSGMIMVGRWR